MIRSPLRETNRSLTSDSIEAAARLEWEQYRNITVNFENVALKGLTSLISIVNQDRFSSTQELLTSYEASGVGIYAPVAIDTDESSTILLPPILERSQHGLLIIDGVHRCLAAFLRGYAMINAAIISNPTSLPPYAGESTPLEVVSPTHASKTLTPLYTGMRAVNPLFRPGAGIVAAATKLIEQKLQS